MIEKFKLFKIFNKISLIKNNEFKISHAPIITNINEDFTYDKEFKKEINSFINIIKTKTPYISLDTFFYNLKTLKITKRKSFNKFIFFKTDIKGQYYIYDNEMSIDENQPQAIYHELLHCASTKKENDKIFSGFSQSINGFGVGTGLNEGYTSFLEYKYFYEIGFNDCYKIEKIIASAIEKIISEEKMLNLYFQSDLYGLIEELTKYSNLDDTLKFLFYLDEIILYTTKTNKVNNVNNKFKYVSTYLLECYFKKMYDLYVKKLITFTYFQDQVEDFLNYIDIEFLINNNHFSLITSDIIDPILKKYKLEAFIEEEKTL